MAFLKWFERCLHEGNERIDIEGERTVSEESFVQRKHPNNEHFGGFLNGDKCDRGDDNGKLDQRNQIDELLVL